MGVCEVILMGHFLTPHNTHEKKVDPLICWDDECNRDVTLATLLRYRQLAGFH